MDVLSMNNTATAAKSLQLCPTLCHPIAGSPPGSPVPGILPARTLEWVAISFSNVWKWKVKAKSLSRVQTPSDSVECSLPGPSIHGIFQARVLEWVAIAFYNTEILFVPYVRIHLGSGKAPSYPSGHISIRKKFTLLSLIFSGSPSKLIFFFRDFFLHVKLRFKATLLK